MLLPELVEEGGAAARGGDLFVAVPNAVEGPALGDRAARERDGALGEVALHDLVRKTVRERLAGADGIAAHDHLERLLRPHHSRQALGAPRAGTEPELDLGEPEARGRDGNPEVAGERRLQPSSEGGAVDRGDHRLRGIVEDIDHLEEARGLERLAELGDVRPGDERTPRAGEDDSGHFGIGDRRPHGVAEPFPDVPAEGVDGGVVDGDDGNAATCFELNGIRCCRGHEGSRAVSVGGSAPTTSRSYHPAGQGSHAFPRIGPGDDGSVGGLPRSNERYTDNRRPAAERMLR